MAESKHWTTKADGKIDLAMRMNGKSGIAGNKPKTVMEVLDATVKTYGDQMYMQSCAPNLETWTWKQYQEDCFRFGRACIHIGMKAHESVNIIGFNSPEWAIADVGAIAAGGIAAGIYTTNAPDACKYVAGHSEAVVVVCDGRKQLAKFQQIQGDLPALKALVIYNDEVPDDAQGSKVPVYSWKQFMDLGDNVDMADLQARIDAQTPDECATLIYTSGTTGPPKAVMISHDSITWTASSMQDLLHLSPQDREISYLPLSHIAAQMLDLHVPMAYGSKIFFARPDALKGSLPVTLKRVKPTIFFGVPRVWEKIAEKLKAAGKLTTGVKRKLVDWAKSKGAAYSIEKQHGRSQQPPCCFGCANSLVLTKIKAKLGLTECRLAATGAAPIAMETLQLFANLDIQIYELYGMSESCGPQTVNFPRNWKIGTVGPAIPGVEMKIEPSNGEICYRGRHIFMGYMKNPKKTKEAIDSEGWLHSGDVGKVDADGFLSITGRIKELIITAGGENVPPVLIEDRIKEAGGAISNVMVIGDRRKFLSCILSLKTDVDLETGVPKNTLTGEALDVAQAIGSEATTIEGAIGCPKFKEYLDGVLEKANEKSTSRAQLVRKWSMIPVDFAVPSGELTPTLKLKRPVATKKYADLIEAMYQ
jgi:long-chain-fatty-acid--CoA ligase ACSBG